jgi:ZIP family zinc transporter
MCVVSILDLWLPFARTSVFSFVVATGAMLVGAAATSLLSRLPIPEPEHLLDAVWGGGEAGAAPARGAAQQNVVPAGAASPARLAALADAKARTAQLAEEGGGAVGGTFAGGGGGASAGGAAGGGVGAGGASGGGRERASWRLGLLLAFVLTIHNLPEGLAVGVSSVKSQELGVTLAAAIFLHNVAEGIVIAVPLLAATGNRALAFAVTAASGLSEPVGALIGVLIIRGIAGGRSAAAIEGLLNLVLCAVGGVMLQISRAELLPQAARLGTPALLLQGFLAGGSLIGLSLFFLPV